MAEIRLPGAIERRSMEIIAQELAERGSVLPPEVQSVVHRVIHATADFDYASSLVFTEDAVKHALEALQNGTPIVTDTNMAKAGISAAALKQLGTEARCFMAEPFIYPKAILAIGNAPTALFRICDLIEDGLRPALIIGVPVGFVNVVESKERALAVCEAAHIPAIIARGRKGGSTVSAAICNALLYLAAGLQDPSARGWN